MWNSCGIVLDESLHNPSFNRVQFDTFRTEAGLNRFVMTPSKWVEHTAAIGIVSKAGRYGGTYAHSDIAMEFASWISAEFKLYLMKDYRRLKFDENSRLSLSWNLNREISKLNYRVHTDAIQQNLLPPDLTREQQSFVYADEADMLNVALFGYRIYYMMRAASIQQNVKTTEIFGGLGIFATLSFSLSGTHLQ